MTHLKIFGFAGSTYVRTACMTCIEKGITYELLPLEFRAESHRARHPFLKMPAMQHDGVALFETLAIGTYVDSLRPTPALQPTAPLARSLMMQWISGAVDYLYRDLVGALLAESVPEGACEVVRRELDVLERGLSRSPFLAGDVVSLADLFVAPMVDFAARKDARLAPNDGTTLNRWLDTMRGRESFQATAT